MITTNPVLVSAPPSPPRRPAPGPGCFVALMYHNICPDHSSYPGLSPSATSYFVSESQFDAQLGALAASGTPAMTWEDLTGFYAAAAAPSGGEARPEGQGVLITFDDGWKEGVDLGGPVLSRHRCQAIVFVTTDFLGRPYFLSCSDVSTLDRGQFRVGSHARSHRMLSLLGEAEIRSELSYSKKLLEDLAGHEVEAVSIPSGAVDRRVRRVAAECGYRFVFDSEVRVNRRGDSPSAIARVAVTRQTSPATFRRYVQGRMTAERLRRAVLSAPKRVLGLRRYERLRRRLLGEQHGQQVTHES
jgi:peptidoglycan/xylan/chitin deacetylase (PgdA/CDA1 family)